MTTQNNCGARRAVKFSNSRKLCTRPEVVEFVKKLTCEGITFVRGLPNQGKGNVYDMGRGMVEVLWFGQEPGAKSQCVQFESATAAKRRAKREAEPMKEGRLELIQGGLSGAPRAAVEGPCHLHIVAN